MPTSSDVGLKIKTMKVRFLKDHLHYSKDQEVEANKGMGNYWCKVGVCEDITGGFTDPIDDSFDAEKRRKELSKMKKAELETILISNVLDPLDYKNHESRIEAIIEAETPQQPEELEVVEPEEVIPANEDFSSEEE